MNKSEQAEYRIQYQGKEGVTSETPNPASRIISGFQIGDWVDVSYLNEEYPGEVTKVCQEELVASVMHRAGSLFKWQKHKDEIAYLLENIITKIEPPNVVGHPCDSILLNILTDFLTKC